MLLTVGQRPPCQFDGVLYNVVVAATAAAATTTAAAAATAESDLARPSGRSVSRRSLEDHSAGGICSFATLGAHFIHASDKGPHDKMGPLRFIDLSTRLLLASQEEGRHLSVITVKPPKNVSVAPV